MAVAQSPPNTTPIEGDSEMSETGSNSPSPDPLIPLCSYGPRLAFTYFSASQFPTAEQLNARSETCFFFTIDPALVYLSFYQDWGPLNVAMFYRFSLHLHGLLEAEEHKAKKIVLYSSDEHDKKANATLLMALYATIVLRWSPAEALHPIANLELRPFRDAGYARADFHLSVQDCLFGIKKAVDLRLLRLDEFDLKEYEHYEKVENGDWNFVTQHFIAFASPVEQSFRAETVSITNNTASADEAERTPQTKTIPKPFKNVLDQFEKKGVKMVIRLNKKLYNKEHFTSRAIQHVEMFYEDGTNPTMDQCRQFIDLSDHTIRHGGVVAVHCKAGLGRTGTLIGAYMAYKWGFTANEAIAFQRFMRPGCVVGPQQHFLYTNQHVWVRWAALDSVNSTSRASLPPALTSATTTITRPETPPSETELQAQVLTNAASPSRASSQQPVNVPGQPRKTPGAKSRHAIALPETNDETEDPADELMLVKTERPPPDTIQLQDGTVDEMQIDVKATREAHEAAHLEAMEVESEGAKSPSPAIDPSPAIEIEHSQSSPHTRQRTTSGRLQSATVRPPSRIAKMSTRSGKPLSSIADSSNRPSSVTPAPVAAPPSPSSVPRSKAVKNLGVYSDQKPQNHQGTERYNLRQTRSASGQNLQQLQQPATLPPIPTVIATVESPSKLPTRVISKRKGANIRQQVQTQDTAKPNNDVFGSAPIPPVISKTIRSTRRRKSSGTQS